MTLSDSARRLIDRVDLALSSAGGQTADSAALEKTREGLADGIAEMRAWMSSLRPPDDAMAHREVMAKLETARAGLETIEDHLNRALASATLLLTRSTRR